MRIIPQGDSEGGLGWSEVEMGDVWCERVCGCLSEDDTVTNAILS